MDEERIMEHINSYPYLRRSILAADHLKRHPFLQTTTGRKRSIVTQIGMLVNTFFGEELVITDITKTRSLIDPETKREVFMIFFYLSGCNPGDMELDMYANFSILLRQIAKSISLVDPQFHLHVNFDYEDGIHLALSSDYTALDVFSAFEDEGFDNTDVPETQGTSKTTYDMKSLESLINNISKMEDILQKPQRDTPH